MTDHNALHQTLKRLSENHYTDQEHQSFIDWLQTASAEDTQHALDYSGYVFENQPDDASVPYPALVLAIETKLDALDASRKETAPVRLWYNYHKLANIAASLLMFIAFAGLFFLNQDFNQSPVANRKTETAKVTHQGHNKAVLKLANGTDIILDSKKNGLIASYFGNDVRKTGSGEIMFESVNKEYATTLNTQTAAYNTITTPKGGQYQVTLPDGTKVWLNAASTLKFPVSFSNNDRRVEMEGEAYFEVAKHKRADGSPVAFKVMSGDQVVEVLGTHFNINAYLDESAITTTLLEGSVRVSKNSTRKSILLKPGQYAEVGSGIRVADIDARQAIAWKNGYLSFSNENIQTIMRSISRWYDMDIIYEKNITREKFIGSISRYKDVSQVLHMLQLTGSVNFRIEGRRIIVKP